MDPRSITFSTLADADEDRLLTIAYDDLPTYPIRPSYKDNKAKGNIDTHLVHFDACPNDPYHATSMPIYQTATFRQESIERFGAYDYSRSGNPTRTACEQLVASLEGAHAAFAFSTGMAAISATTRLLRAGDEILCSDDVYGGAFRLFTRVSSTLGITTRFVDTTDLAKVEAAITPGKTRMIYTESPSNPLARITDLRGLAALCAKYGGASGSTSSVEACGIAPLPSEAEDASAQQQPLKSAAADEKIYLAVDSTMMSPYLMAPLTLGADVVVHSGTKFLAGHSDTMAGFVCCKNDEVAKKIGFVQNAEGSALAPLDSWLVLRGLKTLALRMDRQMESSLKIAAFLSTHPIVKSLYFPGYYRPSANSPATPNDANATAPSALPPASSPALSAAPQQRYALGISEAAHQLHRSQSTGYGSVMSFETGSVAMSKLICDSTDLFKITVSFGAVASLIEMPSVLSHASIPKEQRTLPDDLVRISVGIENVDDLIADLAQAFKRALERFRKGHDSAAGPSAAATAGAPVPTLTI